MYLKLFNYKNLITKCKVNAPIKDNIPLALFVKAI